MSESEPQRQASEQRGTEFETQLSPEKSAGESFEDEAAAITEAAKTELAEFEADSEAVTTKLTRINPESEQNLAAFNAAAEQAKKDFETLVQEIGSASTDMPPSSSQNFDTVPSRPLGETGTPLDNAPTEFPATMRSPEADSSDTVPDSSAAGAESLSQQYLASMGAKIPKSSGDARKIARELGLDIPEESGPDSVSFRPPQPENLVVSDPAISAEIVSKEKQREMLKEMLSGPLKGNDEVMSELRDLESEISDLKDSVVGTEVPVSGDQPTIPVTESAAHSPTMHVEAPPAKTKAPLVNIEEINPDKKD